ncbi:sugar ABC transporter substrate-binding protein [Tautonia plasticadhaerens]|uniref:D-ribose-binding periplasmic protein n=1 Tax=Tautonia plasticadhaerens TaxID=2527974 RepID=A0A518H1L1_9BACT|nr:sugar ABC transporter substrate-binding protein [Tautonia plasticadhaerens]QDV34722.1 D-ribose-binding periplasmic protein precursor [Tautonia plasticadhaerens]
MRSRAGIALALAALPLASCGGGGDAPGGPGPKTVGVAFETLQTEYWVVSFESIKGELEGRGFTVLEAIADGDANRQFEQVQGFIARGVDGIIVAPKDAKTVIPMIRAANRAGIPMVLYNRPPADSSAEAVTIVADNYAIARETVSHMARLAAEAGGAHKAMILIGDLADQNAVDRRRGFDDAIEEHGGGIEVVAEIPTEWNQEKALAGVTNALQADPGIDFIFTSSDFLFPSLVSALRSAGKYEKVGEPGHVILGGFDGDATAYRMLRDGYLDADGVQDLGFESEQTVRALADLIAGEEVPPVIEDEGFVIHQGNLDEMAPRMWGAGVGGD